MNGWTDGWGDEAIVIVRTNSDKTRRNEEDESKRHQEIYAAWSSLTAPFLGN